MGAVPGNSARVRLIGTAVERLERALGSHTLKDGQTVAP